MISTQSRFHTILGGAAGYFAFTFAVLLFGFHLQENYHFVPYRAWLDSMEANSVSKQTPLKTAQTAQPQKALSARSPIKPTDLLPRPEEYANDIKVLKQRQLLFPLQAMPRKTMKNTFRDSRGGGRLHEGVDILAPRNTPVIAIEDGKIARLWTSKFGGITVYQFDPTNSYVYYYAHLEKYAPNLKEGASVKKGQVIGYVGTSGNAPPNTPHLHFAIYRATEPGRWWQGKPIDPYPIYP
ncbi:M23 family metallopeptidase [bacterium]|nr:M23 family metallopeptidase [bacterium]